MLVSNQKDTEQLQTMFNKIDQQKITSILAARDDQSERNLEALRTLNQEAEKKMTTNEPKEGKVTEECTIPNERPTLNIELKTIHPSALKEFEIDESRQGDQGVIFAAHFQSYSLKPEAESSHQKQIEECKAGKIKPKQPPKKAFSFVGAGFGADFFTSDVGQIPKLKKTTSVPADFDHLNSTQKEGHTSSTKKKSGGCFPHFGGSFAGICGLKHKKKTNSLSKGTECLNLSHDGSHMVCGFHQDEYTDCKNGRN